MNETTIQQMRAMSDTAILDWLQETVVDTIYMDSGEVIDVRGMDVRKTIVEAMARPRCGKCRALVEKEKDSEFCSECEREEAAML